MSKIGLVSMACTLAFAGTALAKLPPLDDAAKAKAAEAAAKAAWQGKLDAFQLCKAQDRVAAHYRKTGASKPALTPTAAAPTGAAPAAAAAPVAAAAPAAAAAPGAAAAAAATPSNSGNPTTAAQGGGTPVATAAPTLPACTDPGPFAYTPPEQKPLEAAGAHSPPGTASSPPNVKADSAQIAPAKPATAQSKKP